MSYNQNVLALDRNWAPHGWITVKEAICHEATNEVLEHLGESIYVYHGGINRITGEQSRLKTSSIIVIDGEAVGLKRRFKEPSLTNDNLFKRDCHLCAYCGGLFHDRELTRDHVVPTSKGGKDVWMNVVSACKECNALKGNIMPGAKLPGNAIGPQGTGKMDPLYVPYVPCSAEAMIMKGKNIKFDQMQFLLDRVSNKKSRIFDYAARLFPEQLKTT